VLECKDTGSSHVSVDPFTAFPASISHHGRYVQRQARQGDGVGPQHRPHCSVMLQSEYVQVSWCDDTLSMPLAKHIRAADNTLQQLWRDWLEPLMPWGQIPLGPWLRYSSTTTLLSFGPHLHTYPEKDGESMVQAPARPLSTATRVQHPTRLYRN
jgi:hypothetical protein